MMAGKMHPRKWSTAAVPEAQRLDYWVGAICEGMNEELTASTAMRSGFNSSLESADCGQVVVHRIQGSPLDVYRTKSAISRGRDSSFYLMCQPTTPWVAGQAEDMFQLRPGDCMLFDSSHPYELRFSDRADVMTLQLPVDWVKSWLPDPETHCGRVIDASAGWGQTLSSFVRQLSPEAVLKPPLPAKVMTDQLGGLIALGMGSPHSDAGASHRAGGALVQTIRACIEERFAEPGLTALAVARHLHISERTLHRHLGQSGATFLQQLMRRRMRVAERLLRDPRFDPLAVSEVGRRVGFSDTSHFIRQCRAHLGMTPAVLRLDR